jgi:hypothetical protein
MFSRNRTEERLNYNWDYKLYKWWEHLLASLNNCHARVIYGRRVIKVPFTTA